MCFKQMELFHSAVRKRNLVKVKELLELGFRSVIEYDKDPFLDHSIFSSIPTMKLLTQYSIDIIDHLNNALVFASHEHDFKIMETLLKLGACTDRLLPKNRLLCEQILNTSAQQQLDIYLSKAVEHGKLETVHRLVKHGASVKDEHLKMAFDTDYTSIAKFLLISGVKPSCTRGDVLLQEICTERRLINEVIPSGDVDEVLKLIKEGTNYRVQDDLPMKKAIRSNQYHIVKLLLDLGVVPDKRMIYFPKRKGYDRMCKLLQEHIKTSVQT